MRALFRHLPVAMTAFTLMAWSQWAAAVVGGIPAVAEQSRWMAALVDVSREQDPACVESGGTEFFCKHFCGGTLIASRWVLTAAHCVDNSLSSVSNLRILLGEANLNAADQDVYLVMEKFVHASFFTSQTYDHDVALLYLDRPAAYLSASLIESPLATALDAKAGQADDQLDVYGWGRLANNGYFPELLQRVSLDLLPDASCEAVYNTPFIFNYFPSLMLCVAETGASGYEADDSGDPSPSDPYGEDACTYDSGGPLVYNQSDYPQVAGVVSFGLRESCGRADRPSVYTRIGSFIDWIESMSLSGPAVSLGALPLRDLGVRINAPVSADPGASVVATVVVDNRSDSGSVSGVSLQVQVSGAQSVSLQSQNGMACVAESTGVFNCTRASSLARGASASLSLSIVGPATDNHQVFVNASVEGDGFDDYRSGNDSDQAVVLFSQLPALALIANGVVTEKLESVGKIALFLRVENQSVLGAASSVSLTIADDQDYVLTGGSDGCTQAALVSCSIGALAPGEGFDLLLLLESPAMADGELLLTLLADQASFGGVGHLDEQMQLRRAVVFVDPPLVSSTPPGIPREGTDTPEPVIRSVDGGGTDIIWLVLLGGLLCRRIARR